MTLFVYLLGRFFSMFLRVLLIFIGILLLIGTVDELSAVGEGGVARAVYLAILNQSVVVLQILPLITIIASVSLFIGLSRASELVAVRAAGQSGLRFLLAPCLGAVLVGAVAVAVFDPLVAATGKLYKRETQSGGDSLSISAEGLWLRQGVGAQQSVINAQGVMGDGLSFSQVSFFILSEDGAPVRRIAAQKATLVPRAWALEGAVEWDLAAQNPQAGRKVLADGTKISTDLTPERLSEGFGEASEVGFWALPDMIENLERAGFSARAHRVWLHMELALPLVLAVMVLVAAGFTMRHIRSGNTGKLVLLALMIGFGIFFLRNFAQVLGQNGQIPALLAAWGPPIAALLLSVSLLLHLEDG